MNRTHTGVLRTCGALCSLACATAARAQDSARVVAATRQSVELTALRYVRSDLLREHAHAIGTVAALVLDQRAGDATPQFSKGRPLRAPGYARPLAAALDAPLRDGDSVAACVRRLRGCQGLGRDTLLVRLSPAMVRQDSAFTFLMLLRVAGQPPRLAAHVMWNLVLLRGGDGAWHVDPESARRIGQI